MGFRHLLTTGSYFNMQFVFGELPTSLVPFDERAFFNNPSGFDVVTTSLSSGKSVIFTKKEIDDIISGVDMWIKPDEVVTRLNKRGDYLDKQKKEAEKPVPTPKTTRKKGPKSK